MYHFPGLQPSVLLNAVHWIANDGLVEVEE